MNNKIFSQAAALCIIAAMALPAPVVAQADVSSQVLALLTQIIALQKNLIENLQDQIVQLKSQIALLNKPASAPQEHICAIVNVPACSKTLTVTYDEYNCVTSYFCKP